MQGNPNGNPNPNIAEAGKATQFQPGNTAQKNGKPWSVRHSIRVEGGKTGDLPSVEERKKLTRSQQAAIKIIERAIEGEARHAEMMIENIDGKVVQPNLNADLSRLQDMTDEQLHDEIKRLDAELATFADSGEPDYSASPAIAEGEGETSTGTEAG